jgi:hypothetical protein
MLTTLKTKVDETKKFVQKHQLVIACTASAVAASLVTREIDTRIARGFAYNVGREAGVRDVQLAVLLDFINTKELKDELIEFIPTVKV